MPLDEAEIVGELLGDNKVTDDAIKNSIYIDLVLGAVLLLAFSILQRSSILFRFRLVSPSVTYKPPQLNSSGLRSIWAWIYGALHTSDLELLQSCGLDALMMVKTCALGVQLVLPMTIVGLCVLMPIHSMRGDYLDRSDANTSKFMRFTISNVRQGDKILWVHLLLVYVYLLYAMWLLKWHWRQWLVVRQHFLRKGEEPNLWRQLYTADEGSDHRPDGLAALMRLVPVLKQLAANRVPIKTEDNQEDLGPFAATAEEEEQHRETVYGGGRGSSEVDLSSGQLPSTRSRRGLTTEPQLRLQSALSMPPRRPGAIELQRFPSTSVRYTADDMGGAPRRRHKRHTLFHGLNSTSHAGEGEGDTLCTSNTEGSSRRLLPRGTIHSDVVIPEDNPSSTAQFSDETEHHAPRFPGPRAVNAPHAHSSAALISPKFGRSGAMPTSSRFPATSRLGQALTGPSGAFLPDMRDTKPPVALALHRPAPLQIYGQPGQSSDGPGDAHPGFTPSDRRRRMERLQELISDELSRSGFITAPRTTLSELLGPDSPARPAAPRSRGLSADGAAPSGISVQTGVSMKAERRSQLSVIPGSPTVLPDQTSPGSSSSDGPHHHHRRESASAPASAYPPASAALPSPLPSPFPSEPPEPPKRTSASLFRPPPMRLFQRRGSREQPLIEVTRRQTYGSGELPTGSSQASPALARALSPVGAYTPSPGSLGATSSILGSATIAEIGGQGCLQAEMHAGLGLGGGTATTRSVPHLPLQPSSEGVAEAGDQSLSGVERDGTASFISTSDDILQGMPRWWGAVKLPHRSLNAAASSGGADVTASTSQPPTRHARAASWCANPHHSTAPSGSSGWGQATSTRRSIATSQAAPAAATDPCQQPAAATHESVGASAPTGAHHIPTSSTASPFYQAFLNQVPAEFDGAPLDVVAVVEPPSPEPPPLPIASMRRASSVAAALAAEMPEPVDLLAMPSVRYRKTINTFDWQGRLVAVNAQSYCVLVTDVKQPLFGDPHEDLHPKSSKASKLYSAVSAAIAPSWAQRAFGYAHHAQEAFAAPHAFPTSPDTTVQIRDVGHSARATGGSSQGAVQGALGPQGGDPPVPVPGPETGPASQSAAGVAGSHQPRLPPMPPRPRSRAGGMPPGYGLLSRSKAHHRRAGSAGTSALLGPDAQSSAAVQAGEEGGAGDDQSGVPKLVNLLEQILTLSQNLPPAADAAAGTGGRARPGHSRNPSRGAVGASMGVGEGSVRGPGPVAEGVEDAWQQQHGGEIKQGIAPAPSQGQLSITSEGMSIGSDRTHMPPAPPFYLDSLASSMKPSTTGAEGAHVDGGAWGAGGSYNGGPWHQPPQPQPANLADPLSNEAGSSGGDSEGGASVIVHSMPNESFMHGGRSEGGYIVEHEETRPASQAGMRSTWHTAEAQPARAAHRSMVPRGCLQGVVSPSDVEITTAATDGGEEEEGHNDDARTSNGGDGAQPPLTAAQQRWALVREAVWSGEVADLVWSRQYSVVTATFKRLFPDDFERAVPVIRYKEVDQLLMRLDEHLGAYELAKLYFRKRGRRLKQRQGWLGLFGRRVDALDYHKSKLVDLQQRVVEARARALATGATGSWFVCFKSQMAATVACACTLHGEDNRLFKVHPAPGPEEVNWPALWTGFKQRDLRALLTAPLLWLVVLIPVGIFAGGMQQLDYLFCPARRCEAAMQLPDGGALAAPNATATLGNATATIVGNATAALLSNATTAWHNTTSVGNCAMVNGTAVIKSGFEWSWYCRQGDVLSQGLSFVVVAWLPSLLLIIWQGGILPLLLYLLLQAGSACLSLSDLDRRVASWLFQFAVFNVFLGGMTGSAVVQQISASLQKGPGELLTLVGTSLPASSNFFINYLMFRTVCGIPARLLIPHVGVRLFLVRRYLRCVRVLTDRDKALLYAPVSPRYGFEYGMLSIVFVVATSFSLTSPTVLPLAALFFMMAWTFWRYSLLYVYVRKYESGGLFWPWVARRVVVCLLIMGLFTGCVFVVKEAYIQALLLFGTVPFILKRFSDHCLHRFQKGSLGVMPLEYAHQAPRASVDSWVYIPPPLHHRALGWNPDWAKVWAGWGQPSGYGTL